MLYKDFYPTSSKVIDRMINVDLNDLIIYEPHGGKGDIIDYIKEEYSPKRVIATDEFNPYK